MQKICFVLLVIAGLCSCLPLGLQEDAKVPDGFVDKIAKLEKEPLGFVVRRVMKDNNVDKEEAMDSRLSFLRWASLKFITNESLVPSLETDMFWHAFLMFTHDYRDFCMRHFGEFIDHVPDDEEEDNEEEQEEEKQIEIQEDQEEEQEQEEVGKPGWILACKLMKQLYGVE